MKIIDTDNFGGDYPDEKVIAEGIKRKDHADVMCAALNQWKDHADVMCAALNQWTGKHASRYYMVVEDDYKLRPGFEP